MEALKVAIADDNENMLKVLGQVIGQEQDLSVVGTATNGECHMAAPADLNNVVGTQRKRSALIYKQIDRLAAVALQLHRKSMLR